MNNPYNIHAILVLITAILTFGGVITLRGQTVTTFENFKLNEGEYLNGDDLSGGFESGNIFLPNLYDANYQAWFGWAISATTDTVTSGFTNIYSAVTGGGVESSNSYAITYSIFGSSIHLTGDAAGGVLEGFYITNSTIAYRSMLEGDAFAKKFGGPTGNDPDWFAMTAKKYLNGELHNDSITFYLADYRFDNNDNDYIVTEWTWLDLSPLGNADSILITLNSSDVGMFGMNTPALFCIDNVTTRDMSTSIKSVETEFPGDVFPSPAIDQLTVEWPGSKSADYWIYTISGKVISGGTLKNGTNLIDVSTILPGYYVIGAQDGVSQYVHKFVKH